MILRLINGSKIFKFTLPANINGNYWLSDEDKYGNKRSLVNIEEYEGYWKINSNFDTKVIVNGKEEESAFLSEYQIIFLKIVSDNQYLMLYCSPAKEKTLVNFKVLDNSHLTIGKSATSIIKYNLSLIEDNHAELIYKNGVYSITDLSSKYGTYVNDERVSSKNLKYGDVIFILGIKIIVLKDFIIVNNMANLVSVNKLEQINKPVLKQSVFDSTDDFQIELLTEDKFFLRSPRLKTIIEDVDIEIEAPPSSQEKEKTPAILVIGPMLSMAVMSVAMGYTAVLNLIDGTIEFSRSIPSLVMPLTMMLAAFLWPTLNRRFQEKQAKAKEKLRVEKYSAYLLEKKREIKKEIDKQRLILIDNYLPLPQLKDIIDNKRRNLWEREIKQDDFLDLRLGIGNTNIKGEIKYPEKRFSLEEDPLLNEAIQIGSVIKIIENVPITSSFTEKNKYAIVGTTSTKQSFVDGLVLQMLTYHSYEDLKIVIMTSKSREKYWEYMKIAPHIWNNEKTIRYFSSDIDESRELSLFLEKEFQARKNSETDDSSYKNFEPYYVIITDDYKNLRNIEIIKDIAESDKNFGFTLVVLAPRLTNLPNKTEVFINVNDTTASLFGNELSQNSKKEFTIGLTDDINLYECTSKLANIPLEIIKESEMLPETLGFLEMYNVGQVEQLNISSRWKNSNPTISLQTPIGVGQQNELFKLDLHEKYHGPHGLIAGMTGSGKSEFIVSYILSMAINYHPNEVTFVLIDYKGGGLAGVFHNKETNVKLPHLAGTITNLDVNEMNRALASIQSELKRRQRMFNIARDKLNESAIDIYKYQSLFRKGLVDEPISHLFIISDEFAELKSQRPEFMDQLVSTARIGRSLGVHLILATQKPSGVVNDQIWSNAKFKISLKVQDKADSMDMIKRPDAAELKEVGRFYLQVGYNELFAIGQSAWAGKQYYPSDKIRKKVDNSISVLNNVGNVIKSISMKKETNTLNSHGEEITNIMKYITSEAAKENAMAKQLWLDKISDKIYIHNLINKYKIENTKNNISPLLGEYDDPENQVQGPLRINLSNDGNMVVYGIAGAGKSNFITTLIYSSSIMYKPDDINYYVIDCGSETLGVFSGLPHVGEVLLSHENEKILNLFKYIEKNIESRRNLFLNYNGSYNFYIEHSNKKVPLITIIINNYENFAESFPNLDSLIETISRECFKYGILFILTATTTNAIRYRMKQNFTKNIVLKLADDEYMNILPGARRKSLDNILGRGLIDMGRVLEFQVAKPYEDDSFHYYIKAISKKLQIKYPDRAPSIKILPEIVTVEGLKEKFGNVRQVPVGIEKNSLEISTFDFVTNKINLVMSSDVYDNTDFISGLIKNITFTNIPTYTYDGKTILNEYNLSCKIYVNSNELVNQMILSYDTAAMFVIIDINKFINELSEEMKNKFIKYLDTLNDSSNNLIIFDNLAVTKQLLQDRVIAKNIDLSSYIWVGRDLSNQFTLKYKTSDKSVRELLENDFAFVVNKEEVSIVKIVSDSKERL